MERQRRAHGQKEATTIEIKTIVMRGDPDSLSTAKPQTTLKILKEIETLRMSDLVLDDDDEPPCLAPSFGPDEKLYNNLVALDVNLDCPMKGKTRTRAAVIKDKVPSLEDCPTYWPEPEYSFHRVMTEDLPEVRYPIDGHSIYKLRKKWTKL